MTAPEPASVAGPIDWGRVDLVPVVVQDVDSRQVLMLAFMNAEAFARTRETGRVHFFSRSRGTLWRKGETSGNELVVEEIRVNCEENSLLILATPLGPTCHEGYQSCYFRRIEEDGVLAVVDERLRDPAEIYAAAQAHDSLADASRAWYRAYEALRDYDLTAESGTSRRLRDEAFPLTLRLADELRELAGALDGTHVHAGLDADVRLEGSQTLYWTALVAVRAGVPWSRLRPDRALATTEDGVSRDAAARMLRAEADVWQRAGVAADLAARCHATLALIAQACLSAGAAPGEVLASDLADLRSRPYLASLLAGS